MAVKEYDVLKKALSEVNFEGKEPWALWRPKDVRAIQAMFPYDQGGNGEVDDGFTGNRQSNQTGGRVLFTVSQSKDNPYRFSRLTAYNGTYVPVISLALMKKVFCATLDQFLTNIKAYYQQAAAAWPPNLIALWRDAPHANWSGDLPERKPSEGERAWYLARRDQHPYSMNEWQIRQNGGSAYPFDQVLADDPGAIRIVSVSAQRYVSAPRVLGVNQNWNIDYGATGIEPPQKYKAVIEGVAGGANRYYGTGNQYTKERLKVDKGHVLGAPEGQTKKITQADLKERLYRRKPLRFYFTFNHYRPVLVQTTQGGSFTLNPWVAIAED